MASLTCRDIIRTALRKSGALAAGSEPTASEALEALQALQSLYLEWVDRAVFGRLVTVSASGAYEAGEGERVIANGFTITFPTMVSDDCETRPPHDLALVMVVTAGADPDCRIYDANRAQWVSLSVLTLSDNAPLAGRGADGLAACLSRRIAGEYGLPSSDEVERSANRFITALGLKRTAQTVGVTFC